MEAPPFEVRETGWGGFQIDVRLHFQPYANEKPQWRSHFLQLEPYGSDEEKKLQQERNLVVSEICDFIEFSEPAESLWDALTDELQWVDFSQPKSGKGKGRGAPKIKAPPDDDERWPILPDHAPSSSPYSYQLEAQVLDMLQAAQTEVTALVEEEAARRTAADAKLRELQQGGDVGATEG